MGFLAVEGRRVMAWMDGKTLRFFGVSLARWIRRGAGVGVF
jgi:hypothetical protein